MFNPIQFVKDVIDLLRDPPGEAQSALEITSENIDELINFPEIDPRMIPYLKVGDFVVEFENMVTVVPSKDFKKHYAFFGPSWQDAFSPIITIKPL